MPTKTDYILIGAGILLAVILAAYTPAIVRSASIKSNFTDPSRSFIKSGFPDAYRMSQMSGSSGCNSCGKAKKLLNENSLMKLENIKGIDLNALRMVREMYRED